MSRVYPGHTCAVLTAQGAGTAGRSRGGVRELIAADSGGLGGYKLVMEQQSQRGSRAWRGSEQTALRSMGSDTGSPRLGQLPYQMQVHSQQSRPTHHALMPTLGRPQHSCPAAHPGHSPSDPRIQLPEAECLTVQLALRPLHHKLLPLGPDSSENPAFPFQPDFHHGSHLWIE